MFEDLSDFGGVCCFVVCIVFEVLCDGFDFDFVDGLVNDVCFFGEVIVLLLG